MHFITLLLLDELLARTVGTVRWYCTLKLLGCAQKIQRRKRDQKLLVGQNNPKLQCVQETFSSPLAINN